MRFASIIISAMHLLILTVLFIGVVSLQPDRTVLGPLSEEDGNDETAVHEDSDSKNSRSDEIAEKLIANAMSEKEKNRAGNDQQDSISRSFSVRNGIKTSKRDQVKIKRRNKDPNLKDKKRLYKWYNHHGHGWRSLNNRIKRGKKAAFGLNAKRDIIRNPQKKLVNTETEAASLHIKGVKKPCRISDEMAAMALDVHRAYRKEEHAENMWSLDWDQDLAELSQGLADECVFKHTNLEFANGVRVGQNLGATTGSNHSIERMVHLFMNEKADYNYTEHKWTNVVGHYLQVVNWRTIKVGCAVNKCDNLYISHGDQQEVWNNAWYWVCDYWPPVSYKTRPYDYKDGQVCSECMVPKDSGLGWRCEDQTCQDCKLDGTDPSCKQSNECTSFDEDKNINCPLYASFGMCGGHNFKWSLINCQTSCKLCSTVNDAFVDES